jgi:hypothetical protein
MSSFETFLRDPGALVALGGLVITTLAALLSASEKDSRSSKWRLVVFTVLGFGLGSIAIWVQHVSAVQETAAKIVFRDQWNDAQRKLANAERAAAAADVKLTDLARLNDVSPRTKYHVRLSVDGRTKEPCATVGRLLGLLPDAVTQGDVRLVRRADDHNTPYHLLFGKDLSLAAAEIFQRFAVAHSLSNGFPPIEKERTEEVIPCPNS